VPTAKIRYFAGKSLVLRWRAASVSTSIPSQNQFAKPHEYPPKRNQSFHTTARMARPKRRKNGPVFASLTRTIITRMGIDPDDRSHGLVTGLVTQMFRARTPPMTQRRQVKFLKVKAVDPPLGVHGIVLSRYQVRPFITNDQLSTYQMLERLGWLPPQ